MERCSKEQKDDFLSLLHAKLERSGRSARVENYGPLNLLLPSQQSLVVCVLMHADTKILTSRQLSWRNRNSMGSMGSRGGSGCLPPK